MIVMDLGYKSYVMSNKDAVTMAEIFSKAEMFESVWIRPEDRGNGGPDYTYHNGGPDYTYHIYENEQQVTMKLVSDDFYRMAKLAGKPEKK